MTSSLSNLSVFVPEGPAADAWVTRRGLHTVIRPIQGSDEAMMEAFHRSLSPDSVYRRYFSMMPLGERIRHSRLDHICHPDPREETVLVVVLPGEEAPERIIGVGRLSSARSGTTGELAVIVSDGYQRQGIGTELVRRLIDAGRKRGLARVYAEIMASNFLMQRLCGKAGMHLSGGLDGTQVTAIMDL